MAQTPEGARKAVESIKRRYGEEHFKKIGSAGGRVSHGGGFTYNPELASRAGRKGGLALHRKIRNNE